MSSVAARSARFSISGVTGSRPRGTSRSARRRGRRPRRSAGGGTPAPARAAPPGSRRSSIFVPRSSSQTIARISTRSTTPRKCSSWPIGSCIGTGFAPRRSTIDCTEAKKSAPVRSILLMNAMRGTLVLVGLAPDRLGLRLDAGDGVEDGDRAVEHAQAALHLDGEVHVPGRIDDVDAVVAPERRRRSRRDRDAALLLLRHPVHRRGALVHLAHLVGAAGVVEDPLGRRGLARVDVGHDPDVPDALERDAAVFGLVATALYHR